jgi:formylglycine-generating enzyme required for sulfatase activity
MLLAGLQQVAAQNAQFFRIVGPTMTTILTFKTDGTVVWSNAQPGATYAVQMVTALAGANNWMDHNQWFATNNVNTNNIYEVNTPAGMTLIPAGTFTIGDTLDGLSDALPTNVTVSAFYVDANLVSLSQWQGVYSYATSHGYSFAYSGSGKAANTPVESVDWYDAVKWSNARSAQAGLTPAYYTDEALTRVFTNGDSSTMVYVNWSANGYRLATEAEWEKAARGGLTGQRFPWGNTISETKANYYGNTSYGYDLGPDGFNSVGNYPTNLVGTSPAGSFQVNGYGLNDMAGNLFEWCWDWYAGPTYPAGSPYLGGTDPRGPTGSSGSRVVRGGSWAYDASYARCAYRYYVNPTYADTFTGFRCVRAQ